MRQRNINFRQSNSERSAESSYSNFKKSVVKIWKYKNLKNKNK